MNNYERAYAIRDEIIAHRRTIHPFAEVGYELPKTRAYVWEKLVEYGYEPTELADGIVATVGKGGKTFLLRADMDALPFREESGLEYAASNGCCHACGHDIHTSVLLGAAKLLKDQEAKLQGTVKLVFQPAEELLTGAEKMVKAGVLENPKVDCGLMCHVTSSGTEPSVALLNGPKCASSNNFRIEIKGKGSHGSMPASGIDPVYIGAQIIIGCQELISREISFEKSAVLTMGHFEAGSAANVIPSTAFIEGTYRTYTLETQNYLKKRLPEVVSDIAKTYRGEAVLEFTCDVPVMYNDPTLGDDVSKYIHALAEQSPFAITDTKPSPGSEDFAFIANEVPGYMLGLNLPDPESPVRYPLHNPKVRFDEGNIPLGSAIMAECAMKWLEEHK